MKTNHMRVAEFAERSGWQVSTVRKKLQQRLIGYRKSRQDRVDPGIRVGKSLGDYRPAVGCERQVALT